MNAERSELSGPIRRRLRALGRTCPTLMRVGKAGLTPAVTETANALLAKRELVKLRVLESAPMASRELADRLGGALAAEAVSVVGRMVLLYRPNTDLPQEKRLKLS